MVDVEASEALARCRELTTRGANHLHEAARQLPDAHRYTFFLAAYAAMRALEDLIDREFLDQAADVRAARRDHVLERLQRWEEQVRLAAAGAYLPGEDDFEALVFTALNRHLGHSDLGAEPFLRLSRSLRRDIEERGLRDWDEWYDYCEGAAVAPGAVFLYLLTARDDGGRLETPSGLSVMDEARELARFCYLTHIVRDLSEDARGNPQLLTIPGEILEQAGFDRERFRRAASDPHADSDPAVRQVATRLLQRAAVHAHRAEARMPALSEYLGEANRAVLERLFHLYRDAFVAVERQWQS